MIHTTVGVYPNLNAPFKSNGVTSENLDNHIKYNKFHRGGRALFVDGECVHQGGVTDEDIIIAEERVAGIVLTEDTAPYH